MSKLNVGDRVRILYDNDSDLSVGSVHTIHHFDDNYIVILDPDATNIDWYFEESHLELVEFKKTTVRGEVLLEAKNLIEGDRNLTYGEPTENFKNIAGMWNILFAHKLNEQFTPADIAQAMIAMKQCRTITQPKRDNFVDIAGYAAIGWEAQSS